LDTSDICQSINGPQFPTELIQGSASTLTDTTSAEDPTQSSFLSHQRSSSTSSSSSRVHKHSSHQRRSHSKSGPTHHVIPASQIHLHHYSSRGNDLPVTSAFNLLETDSELLTSQQHHHRHATHHKGHHQARLDLNLDEQLPQAPQAPQAPTQVGAWAVKRFEVCYTRGATTFLFVTPVPDVDNFTCADRLFDHREFFASLNLGPRKIMCPPGCLEGKIYGKDVYTVDSQVCMAAAHATTHNGGEFVVTLVHDPTITDYVSDPVEVTLDPTDLKHTQTVTSLEYHGAYPTSFTVVLPKKS